MTYGEQLRHYITDHRHNPWMISSWVGIMAHKLRTLSPNLNDPEAEGLYCFDRCLDAGLSLYVAKRAAYLAMAKHQDIGWVPQDVFNNEMGTVWKALLSRHLVDHRPSEAGTKTEYQLSDYWRTYTEPEEHGEAYDIEGRVDTPFSPVWLLADGSVRTVSHITKGVPMSGHYQLPKPRRFICPFSEYDNQPKTTNEAEISKV